MIVSKPEVTVTAVRSGFTPVAAAPVTTSTSTTMTMAMDMGISLTAG